jgi:hypothetical protein
VFPAFYLDEVCSTLNFERECKVCGVQLNDGALAENVICVVPGS